MTDTVALPAFALPALRSDGALVELESFVTPGPRWDAFVSGVKDIMDGFNARWEALKG